ncbi:MAG TPA: sulfur carrier protein ThiS [Nevskiaceae bacterium]|nr:sulfur carrier protein ThiS [Nevskiaceae bacterium]
MGSIPIARSIFASFASLFGVVMQIQVNGATEVVPEQSTLSQLIDRLRLSGKRVAVELNGEIVPRSAYAARPLKENDVLEIVAAIGGG